MRALTWQGNQRVSVEQVPDPRIERPTDAIVAITSTAICGSDLHLDDLLGPYLSPATCSVTSRWASASRSGQKWDGLAVGDGVVVPFAISCGHCSMCSRQLYAQCETTQIPEQGKGAALFGYTSLHGSVPGGQAGPLHQGRPAAVTASPVGATRTAHRRAPDPARIAGAGTGESRWRAWPGLAGLQPLTSTELPDQDPLLVAPHPDDEILGAGGLLAMLGAQVAAVTDGEASHPGSQVHRPDQLARLRRAETRAALSALGRSETTVHHLGHGDGAVDEVRLAEQLGDLLSPGRWCIATWRGDGHPDHEAAGRAAARACAATGARLIEYPIWMWHWARPGDPRVPWHQARRLVLSPSVRAAKRAAVGCFATQIHPLGPEPADAPVLPPPVLARFDRDFETYFVSDPFPRVQDLNQRVPGPGL